MPKLLETIKEWGEVAWVVTFALGVLTFIGSTAWNVSSKNQLLESTTEQMRKVESIATVAARTAQTAAADVNHLKANVAKADDKLDQIIEQQGRSAGQLDILIQMQTQQRRAEKGIPEIRPASSYYGSVK